MSEAAEPTETLTVARGGFVACAFGAAADDPAGAGAPAPPHAETSRTSAADSPMKIRVSFMASPPSPFRSRFPAREPALHDLQEGIERERQRGDDDDTAEHARRVEERLGVGDPPPYAHARPDVLGDDRSREGETGARPQAGHDRAECRRQQHLEGHVAAPRAQDADIVDERLVDVTYRREGGEEHDEEDEGHAERHLARQVDPA